MKRLFGLVGFHCHAKKIETDPYIKSRTRKMKGGKYVKTHAKIQVKAIFRVRDIYRALYGDAMLVHIRMDTNMAAGNQQKHLSLSFATTA